ncbi:AAA family ATPase [Propylenella binzhouense]|uniref:Endonuclease GajA/Old nuclease/RecF-like AAA domain-containing protein n=1 Tax=Propylenella binzhouense TaxID=2555902 RepID=A0A964T4I2_9HYPH|nr:ATP-binding protein [Propylenella binzhouense]MYZ48338.1 hypothetical protein [Propylenella binzhouense]
MFLKTIGLKNFRSFDAGEIELQKDLTVFVGENNGGKSNAIDAIRLVTQPLGGRREIYCEPTDVRFQSPTKGFELEAAFSDLSVGQQGRLISATTDSSLSEARFGIRYNGAFGDRPSCGRESLATCRNRGAMTWSGTSICSLFATRSAHWRRAIRRGSWPC